jgi:hypothetical protein
MLSRPDTNHSSSRSNTLALGISLLAGSILYASTNPETSGADPSELVGYGSTSLAVKLAPVIHSTTSHDTAEAAAAKGKEAAQKPDSQSVRKPVAQGRIALLMNTLMLEKARTRVASFSGYKVMFHKHERIDGTLQDPQTISMDIRHKPFSVYMKWKTGDKGRQLLFVPEKHDGKAIVRFGGIKGRLIPPVKIDPDGSRAMAESRYPITKAGILPVIDAVIAYRKEDIAKRTGLICTMYDDEIVNDRKVYSFRIEYPSNAVSKEYRVAVSYLDQETLMPVRLCNYTWAVDAEDLTPEELDEQTLIEDYAFTDLEVSAPTQLTELFTRKKL